jgi:hypothetical protein
MSWGGSSGRAGGPSRSRRELPPRAQLLEHPAQGFGSYANLAREIGAAREQGRRRGRMPPSKGLTASLSRARAAPGPLKSDLCGQGAPFWRPGAPPCRTRDAPCRQKGNRSREGLRGDLRPCEFVGHDEHDKSPGPLQSHRAPRRGVHLGHTRRRAGGAEPGVRDRHNGDGRVLAFDDAASVIALADGRPTRSER